MTNGQNSSADKGRQVIRCYIYARVAQSDPAALERQIQDSYALAETLSTSDVEYQVINVFQDDGRSASGHRPGFEEMLAGLEGGEATVVLVFSEERLYRNSSIQEMYSALCERRGVTTYSVRAGKLDLAASFGRFMP